MLTEEAVIALAALGALGLALLGAWELLWPSRRRGGRRRPARAARVDSAAAPPTDRPKVLQAPPIVRTPIFARPPVDAPSPSDETTPDRTAPTVAATVPTVTAAPAPDRIQPSAAPADDVRATGRLVDDCFDLYQARKFDDVIARGVGALTMEPLASAGPEHAADAAALWSVVALARQAKGDDAGSRAALENAILSAPPADRATYERQLGALAVSVGQAAIARASTHPAPESEARVSAIREALAWLERGQTATPDDPALRDLAGTARAMLWPAYEQVALALVQRQEFRAARRLLREALGSPDVPESRAATYRELMSGTFGGEIGQLTAQAIRSMQEARESEALTALTRAEGLLETVSEAALPPKRREEVDRRLWWGYNRLGVRRVDAAEYEAALDPLFAALRFSAAGPDRLAETRAALVRALSGAAEARALAIAELADAGDREAALVQADSLWTLLRSGREAGIADAELSPALERTRRLFAQLGSARE